MPLPEGTRYRWKKLKSGKKIRLAFTSGSNKVIEVKKEGGKAKKLADSVPKKLGV
jgi:hypothetical protein